LSDADQKKEFSDFAPHERGWEIADGGRVAPDERGSMLHRRTCGALEIYFKSYYYHRCRLYSSLAQMLIVEHVMSEIDSESGSEWSRPIHVAELRELTQVTDRMTQLLLEEADQRGLLPRLQSIRQDFELGRLPRSTRGWYAYRLPRDWASVPSYVGRADAKEAL
jgi:hypothetical protein